MSVYDDMARDGGYTGDQAAQVARQLEEQHRESVEADADAPIYGPEPVEHLALVGEFDAQKWAVTFVQTYGQIPEIAGDVDTMQAWFATAIMAGYDRARNEANDAA